MSIDDLHHTRVAQAHAEVGQTEVLRPVALTLVAVFVAIVAAVASHAISPDISSRKLREYVPAVALQFTLCCSSAPSVYGSSPVGHVRSEQSCPVQLLVCPAYAHSLLW